MARKKVPTEPTLASWAEVDEALREIAQQERGITKREVAMNKQIEAAKADCVKASQPLLDKKEQLEKQVEDFVRAHKEDLGDKKSRQLTYGTVGFRSSTSLVVPKGSKEAVLKNLHLYGLRECIKTEETILRDVLKQKAKEMVEKVGCHLVPKETYFKEIDYQRVGLTN